MQRSHGWEPGRGGNRNEQDDGHGYGCEWDEGPEQDEQSADDFDDDGHPTWKFGAGTPMASSTLASKDAAAGCAWDPTPSRPFDARIRGTCATTRSLPLARNLPPDRAWG